MLKGKLEINRLGNIVGEDWAEIKLVDDSSSLQVTTIKVSLDMLMRTLMGYASTPCEYQISSINSYNKYGKQKIIKDVYINVPLSTFVVSKARELVQRDFEQNYRADNWEIFRDGTSISQELDRYRYQIVRYE